MSGGMQFCIRLLKASGNATASRARHFLFFLPKYHSKTTQLQHCGFRKCHRVTPELWRPPVWFSSHKTNRSALPLASSVPWPRYLLQASHLKTRQCRPRLASEIRPAWAIQTTTLLETNWVVKKQGQTTRPLYFANQEVEELFDFTLALQNQPWPALYQKR